MQEDRPGLGIGLQRRERPVGQDQIFVAGCDIPEAMAARHAVAVRYLALRREAVGIGPAVLQRRTSSVGNALNWMVMVVSSVAFDELDVAPGGGRSHPKPALPITRRCLSDEIVDAAQRDPAILPVPFGSVRAGYSSP